jgi:hypothetical protein
MTTYHVLLMAYRLEWNRMHVEADTPEEACRKAIAEDDGEYEGGDLGAPWVENYQIDDELEEHGPPLEFSESPFALEDRLADRDKLLSRSLDILVDLLKPGNVNGSIIEDGRDFLAEVGRDVRAKAEG